jgi:hypothetical protein
MFGRKIEKESAQDHVIVVSGVEKEYATRKVAMMDSRGSGEGQVATTTGEGQQVERKLSLEEREMIWSMNKTFGTQRVVDHEPFVEWDVECEWKNF